MKGFHLLNAHMVPDVSSIANTAKIPQTLSGRGAHARSDKKRTITAGRQTIARPFPAVIDDRHNVIQQQERVGLRYAIYMHYLRMFKTSKDSNLHF